MQALNNSTDVGEMIYIPSTELEAAMSPEAAPSVRAMIASQIIASCLQRCFLYRSGV